MLSLLEAMSEQLSSEGLDIKNLCDNVADAVSSSIEYMVGTPESGVMLEMGADGTPTKSIDRAAENAVLSQLRLSGHGFKVLSEEIGEVLIGEVARYFINLDPLDGTFNAIRGIPFYSVSLYLRRNEFQFGYVCDLASGARYFAEAGRGAFSEPGGRLSVSETSIFNDFSVSAYTIRPHTSRIVAVGENQDFGQHLSGDGSGGSGQVGCFRGPAGNAASGGCGGRQADN
jgi:myo-inositol-1(or 4)-monophosphatase